MLHHHDACRKMFRQLRQHLRECRRAARRSADGDQLRTVRAMGRNGGRKFTALLYLGADQAMNGLNLAEQRRRAPEQPGSSNVGVLTASNAPAPIASKTLDV